MRDAQNPAALLGWILRRKMLSSVIMNCADQFYMSPDKCGVSLLIE